IIIIIVICRLFVLRENCIFGDAENVKHI
ncbi:MAG: hypothetical protein K0S61_454, partial [Anaerocolumna sp.]|nr:hypothetical protein [Anaerocolumna sp.]